VKDPGRRLAGRISISNEVCMAKEELIELEGLVTEILPDTRFRVKLDNGHEIIAYAAGRMKKNRIKDVALRSGKGPSDFPSQGRTRRTAYGSGTAAVSTPLSGRRP
jgi:Translation initiation factor 1A / IF-1